MTDPHDDLPSLEMLTRPTHSRSSGLLRLMLWTMIVVVVLGGTGAIIFAFRLSRAYTAAYHLQRAIDYAQQEQPVLAIVDYTKAIELTPDIPRAYYYRGNAYFDLKQYEPAIADYTKAIELDGNYADAYFNRALSHAEQKHFEQAINDYNRVLELQPNSADVYWARAGVYDQEGQDDKALTDYQRHIDLAGKDAITFAHQRVQQLKAKLGR